MNKREKTFGQIFENDILEIQIGVIEDVGEDMKLEAIKYLIKTFDLTNEYGDDMDEFIKDIKQMIMTAVEVYGREKQFRYNYQVDNRVTENLILHPEVKKVLLRELFNT